MNFVNSYTREYGLHFAEICMFYLTEYVEDLTPLITYRVFFVPDGNREAYYIHKKDLEQLKTIWRKKYQQNFNSFKKIEVLMHKLGKESLKISAKTSSKIVMKTSNEQLAKYFEDYWISMVRYTYMLYLGYIESDIITEMAEQTIKSRISNKKIKKEYLSTLFYPQKKASIFKMKEEVLKSKNPKTLYEKYKWVPCVDVIHKPWDKEQFIEAIKEFKVDAKPKYSLSQVLNHFNKKEQDLIKMGNLSLYIRDARDEYRRRVFCNIQTLLKEIAKRIGVEDEDIGWMLKHEILSALNGKLKPNLSEIRERKKGFALYFSRKDLVCVSGEDISKIKERFCVEKKIGKSNINKSKLIKGISANNGMVTGIVKIVYGAKDLEKVKKGDIIVAVTTHPNYIAAMERASAFVTDEGGLTCHAAILSREMGKPCVIGTKIATKILKEGMKVEVDANHGVVKIIR